MRTEFLPATEYDHRVGFELSAPQFRKFLAIRGDRPAPLVTYQEPYLELMSPSKNHEVVKVLLCRLLEAWADERGVELHGMGSATLKSARTDKAIEPDASYLVGTTTGAVPDLAIEVVWSHRSERSLQIYAALGVREVWTWREERLSIHVLRRGRLVPSARSAVLADLDLEELAHFLARWRRPAGLVRAYRLQIQRH